MTKLKAFLPARSRRNAFRPRAPGWRPLLPAVIETLKQYPLLCYGIHVTYQRSLQCFRKWQ